MPSSALAGVDALGGGMRGDELVEVLEQQLGHLVGGLVGDAVMGDQEVADRGGGDVRRPGPHRCRRGWSRRHRASRSWSTMSAGTATTVIGTRGREVADRGDAEAGRLQRGVELAVLDQLDRFGERQVLDLAEVVVAHAGGGEDRAGVELGAGCRRADRQALALQVGERLDAGFLRGDDLDVVRIDGGDAAQLVELGRETRPRRCRPSRASGNRRA